jgi:hypothetical protein
MTQSIPHLVLVATFAAGGCAAKKLDDADNPDVAQSYRGEDKNKYETDIVTHKKRHDYDDQGKGIAPKTLQALEDTITNVYKTDFKHCLEEQMDAQETRFMRSVFTLEFTIDTKGKVTGSKIIEIWVKKQNAKGSDIGEVDSAGMKDCITAKVAEWEFDPPPEVVYKHTYRGQVGEAF